MDTQSKIERAPLINSLVVYAPLGLLTLSVVFDTISIFSVEPIWAELTVWVMLLGLLAALVGVPSALIDWLAMPQFSEVRELGAYNCLAKIGVIVAFSLSWFLRLRGSNVHPITTHLFSYLGLALQFTENYFSGQVLNSPELRTVDDAKIDARSLLISDEPEKASEAA